MKIILAYDGSEHAARALHALATLIRPPAHVLVVGAVQGMALDAEGNPAEPDAEELQAAQTSLAKACSELGASGEFKVTARVLVGDPAHLIPQLALDEQATLIVTGSRGLGLAGRVVFGSVSHAILHHTECAVMVVR